MSTTLCLMTTNDRTQFHFRQCSLLFRVVLSPCCVVSRVPSRDRSRVSSHALLHGHVWHGPSDLLLPLTPLGLARQYVHVRVGLVHVGMGSVAHGRQIEVRVYFGCLSGRLVHVICFFSVGQQ